MVIVELYCCFMIFKIIDSIFFYVFIRTVVRNATDRGETKTIGHATPHDNGGGDMPEHLLQ